MAPMQMHAGRVGVTLHNADRLLSASLIHIVSCERASATLRSYYLVQAVNVCTAGLSIARLE